VNRYPARSLKGFGTRGQALIEMALVVVTLVTLIAGIAEVGFAFIRSSVITHAARDGARFGATLPTASRNPATGCITTSTDLCTHVNEVLSSVGFNPTSVSIAQQCDGPTPTITVNIQGNLDMLMLGGLLADSYAVDRSVTFEDENRVNPCAACGGVTC
jgi:Flp pilus assembly protein TadG